jgi:hypothetical protein
MPVTPGAGLEGVAARRERLGQVGQGTRAAAPEAGGELNAGFEPLEEPATGESPISLYRLLRDPERFGDIGLRHAEEKAEIDDQAVNQADQLVARGGISRLGLAQQFVEAVPQRRRHGWLPQNLTSPLRAPARNSRRCQAEREGPVKPCLKSLWSERSGGSAG